jgi:hypothetical protein
LKRRVTQLEEENKLELEFKHTVQDAFQSQVDALTAEKKMNQELIAKLERQLQQSHKSLPSPSKSIYLHN